MEAGTSQRGPVRHAVFAGRFYPRDPASCAKLTRAYVEDAPAAPAARWIGAVVPHAGWICSGAIAGQSIAALKSGWNAASPRVVVVFGAIHQPLPAERAVLDEYGAWQTPGALSNVATDLRRHISERDELFITDDRFHRPEHAVEVELPLIQHAWPDAMILPVQVPAIDEAPSVGVTVARQLASQKLERDAVFLASSDLTHYGPAYDFAPAGVGEDALEFAKDNDRRLLERIERLDVEGIVPEVMARSNACGPGAIAAMLAACREWGASRGLVLRHANSFETLHDVAPQEPDNAVGYASVVIG